jgi:hypothetical protein
MQNGLPTMGEAGAVGTSGRDRSAAEASLVYSLHETETLFGAGAGDSLIGRTVQLQVPVANIANDQAFWAGDRDNRLLVVPTRDHRDSTERQLGLTTGNTVAPLDRGKTAIVSGVIQRMPMAEQVYSWGLTTRDREELAARGVFLRADHISVQ